MDPNTIKLIEEVKSAIGEKGGEIWAEMVYYETIKNIGYLFFDVFFSVVCLWIAGKCLYGFVTNLSRMEKNTCLSEQEGERLPVQLWGAGLFGVIGAFWAADAINSLAAAMAPQASLVYRLIDKI